MEFEGEGKHGRYVEGVGRGDLRDTSRGGGDTAVHEGGGGKHGICGGGRGVATSGQHCT